MERQKDRGKEGQKEEGRELVRKGERGRKRAYQNNETSGLRTVF